MRLRTQWLMLRMWLNVDPWARAANRRHASLQATLATDRIRRKALLNQRRQRQHLLESGIIRYISGDRVILDARMLKGTYTQIAGVPEDAGDTVLDMTSSAVSSVDADSRDLRTITDDGIVVLDPTDEETMAMMHRFEMGNVHEHERASTLIRVDTAPPDSVDFDWEGVTHLG